MWEVLENNEYGFAFKDLVVIDAGCNVGSFSLWIYPQTKAIYAIDNDEEVLNLFAKTVKDNKMKNVFLTKGKLGNGKNDTVTLTDLVKDENRIDLMKIDIEGGELEVVNAKDFPKNKINTIIGEHHYNGTQLEEFKTRLRVLGYEYTEKPNSHFICRK